VTEFPGVIIRKNKTYSYILNILHRTIYSFFWQLLVNRLVQFQFFFFLLLVICFWVTEFCNRWVYPFYWGKYCFQSQGAVAVQLHSWVSCAFLRNLGMIIQHKAENSHPKNTKLIHKCTEGTENLISNFCLV
jgi:hypothetical protein